VQLTFLVTSPRVPAGLMSWPAWQAVSSAERVVASDDTLPVARAVAAAGYPVDVLPSPSGPALLETATSGTTVWLASDEEAERLPGELAAVIVSAGEEGRDLPAVEVLHASYDMPGARLLDLVTVMDRLRTSCPWDREQTHRSLARYLLEEAYETLEAIEHGDYVHLREELGDLLLQVYFHARIAAEHKDRDGDSAGGFDIDDVAGGIVDKLVRRHPHVFAGVDVADVQEVEANWETLKASEKSRTSVLEGVPLTLPGLALADKVLGRASKVGVDPSPGDALGDRLLALVAQARADGLDAEQEVRDAVRRLADAVRAAEQR
jgi:XTP/dITP diphosphohydrolase